MSANNQDRRIGEDDAERFHQALMSQLWLICQPDRGDVFSFMDDQKDAIRSAFISALAAGGSDQAVIPSVHNGKLTPAEREALAETVRDVVWEESGRRIGVGLTIGERVVEAVIAEYLSERAEPTTGVIYEWTRDAPTEQAWYWHWDGDEDSEPLLWCVLKSGSDGHCFTSANQHGVTHSIACADWGGWWRRNKTPKTPEDAP